MEKRKKRELHEWLRSSRNPYLDQNVDAEKFLQKTHENKMDEGADDLSGFIRFLRENTKLMKVVFMSALMW